MVCLVRKNIRYGGAELLLERMALYLKNSGKECVVLCNNISDVMVKRLSADGIEVQIEKKWINSGTIKKLHNRGDLLFITTWIHDCLVLDMLRNKTSMKFGLLHYIVAADDLCLGKSIKPRCLYSLFHKYYCDKIKELNNTGAIIYMDTESIEKTEMFYDLELAPRDIVRLPYEVSDIDRQSVEMREKNRRETFNILSISRSEFPMKGYLIELVKNFKDFNIDHPNSRLIIVSFGEGQGCLEDELAKLPPSIQKNVELHGQMGLDELNEFWKKASVYVGLGTSVLDAANRGVCAIPALQYSMTFRASHIFFEKPEQISSDVDTNKNGYDLIEKIYNSSSEEYINMSVMCHEKLFEYYNLNSAMDKLLSLSRGKIESIEWRWRDRIIEDAFLKFDDFRYKMTHRGK